MPFVAKLRFSMNRYKTATTTLALFAASIGLAQARPIIGARSLALSPDGTKLAFTWRGDIWVVKSEGGRAVPITSNIEMDDNPIWSPDGNTIAFATNRNGNWDTYLADVDGGETRRLTYSSFSEVPNDWSSDGKSLVMRAWFDDKDNGIYTIDTKTGKYKALFLDNRTVGLPKLNSARDKVIYVRRYGFPWNRPRYFGSGSAELNLMDLTTGKRSEVRTNGFQNLWPHWSKDGNSVYAITCTEVTPSSTNVFKQPKQNTDNAARTPNVSKISLDGKVTRLTNLVGGAGARFLSVAANGSALAYEVNGNVFVMRGDKSAPIVITASIDEKTTAEERLILRDGVSTATLSPKGDRFVFSVRRELWSVPTKKGKGPNADDAEQLTDWIGSDDIPIWTPDDDTVLFASDRKGAYQLFKLNVNSKEVTQMTTNTHDIGSFSLTPDKKSLAFVMAGPEKGLYTIPLSGGPMKLIVKEPDVSDYKFSPDMRYVAFNRTLLGSGFNPWENKQNLWVRELATGKEVNVTNLAANHGSPEWSADGKYLYFISDRGSAGGRFAQGGGGNNIFALPLQAESARPTELELKYEKPKETPKFEFDFNDVDSRIRRIASGPASNLVFDPQTGNLLYNLNGDIALTSYDGETTRPITAGAGIGGFELSQDGNNLVLIRGGLPATLNLRHPQFQVTQTTFRADWTRDIRKEREAALQEFWRVYNYNFYDANFHGRNWAEVKDRYLPLLDGVGHRNEMATVLNMMVGELESSHSEVGPAAGNPGSQQTASLGFSSDTSYAGPGIKVKMVPEGSPAKFPATQIKPGEIVTKINGKEVNNDQNLWRLLNDQAGRELRFEILNPADKSKPRAVKYRAISDGQFDGLIAAEVVRTNRRKVDASSNGKVGYVYIAAMGGGDFNTFNAEVWQYINEKKALIIDVRDNNGGNIADQLLDILERRPQMVYRDRDGVVKLSPGTLVNIPIVVMINERSVSNGEMFPAAMKSRGFATLVGWTTPGYVIYTYGGGLVDGTSIRIPGTGVYRVDGSPLENNGEKPDVSVDWSPEDYFGGKDPQLDSAIKVAKSKMK